jgi:glyoxylase-like metal-dependent hydrolase (beta-lactamase superfamily II)
VKPLSDGQVLTLAGLELTVDHTPGHTPGSVTFRLPHDEVSQVMLSGDLLFAGSIGRSDLPGGDPDVMMASLAKSVLTLDDDVVVLPGHGDQTTIGRERATNPFLRHLVAAPPRGL